MDWKEGAHHELLAHDLTFNSKFYRSELDRLKGGIKEKCPGFININKNLVVKLRSLIGEFIVGASTIYFRPCVVRFPFV